MDVYIVYSIDANSSDPYSIISLHQNKETAEQMVSDLREDIDDPDVIVDYEQRILEN